MAADQLEQALLTFTRALMDTLRVSPVRVRVDVLEDREHPLILPLEAFRIIVNHEKRQQAPSEGPGDKTK